MRRGGDRLRVRLAVVDVADRQRAGRRRRRVLGQGAVVVAGDRGGVVEALDGDGDGLLRAAVLAQHRERVGDAAGAGEMLHQRVVDRVAPVPVGIDRIRAEPALGVMRRGGDRLRVRLAVVGVGDRQRAGRRRNRVLRQVAAVVAGDPAALAAAGRVVEPLDGDGDGLLGGAVLAEDRERVGDAVGTGEMLHQRVVDRVAPVPVGIDRIRAEPAARSYAPRRRPLACAPRRRRRRRPSACRSPAPPRPRSGCRRRRRRSRRRR